MAAQPDNTSDFEDLVKSVIVRALALDVPLSEITREASPFDLGADSMNIVELFLGLEETFDFTIADDELRPEIFRTFGHILDFVSAKVASR